MTSANVSVQAAGDIARLAKLMDHPVRIRLMFALAATGPSSATALSVRFGDVTVSDCHYHLKTLKDGGVVKLVRSRQVRGATERIYHLDPGSPLVGGAPHLRHFIDVVTLAASAPGLIRADDHERPDA